MLGSLRVEDRCLLGALRIRDGCLPRAFRLDDRGATCTLGGHLAAHGVLDVARRQDLANLDCVYLDAPSIGDIVEAGLHERVDLFALGEHIVEVHVADDGAQRRDRHAACGLPVVLHLEDGRLRVYDLHENEHVDRDGRVVLCDRRLRLDVEHFLAQVDGDRLVVERDDPHPAGAARRAVVPPETEASDAAVLGDDREEERHSSPFRRQRTGRCLVVFPPPR